MERQRHRFLAMGVQMVFGQIEKHFAGNKNADVSTRRYQKRAFNKMGGWSYPHNGARECARRRQQIEAGQLTRSNGLSL